MGLWAATPAPADFRGANYCTLAIVHSWDGVLLRPPEGGHAEDLTPVSPKALRIVFFNPLGKSSRQNTLDM